MKNMFMVLFAAIALVGCREGTEVNEPAGSDWQRNGMERPLGATNGTDTNAVAPVNP